MSTRGVDEDGKPWDDEWKNFELSAALYEAAMQHLVEWDPGPPSTRAQRLRWWFEERKRRVRRAWEALRGLDGA